MTAIQKQDALQNAMASFEFPKKYFVHPANKGRAIIFTIASKNDHDGINTHSRFMTYDEFNAYLRGWYDAKMKKL